MIERFIGYKAWMMSDEGKGIFDIVMLSLISGVAIGILYAKVNGL